VYYLKAEIGKAESRKGSGKQPTPVYVELRRGGSNIQHRILNGRTRVTATLIQGMQKAAGGKQKLGKQKLEGPKLKR
jgi:hypothetical protein